MWRLVLTVVLWNTISSQPVTDDSEGLRTPRQLDLVKCCPCPVSSRTGLQDVAAAPSAVSFSRTAPVDDCPCRIRDADSQGSSSLFLPREMRPVRPFMTSDEPKEDVKPLLKPEVGLASSMLETLREVTDEEYQEALARDAARNAARISELRDAEPETAKNVLTIIVNPTENNHRDATPEASQPFETRCIYPSNLGQVRKVEKASVFKVRPNLLSRNPQDMESGASEVQENVIGLNKGLEGLGLKTTPSVLKLFPTKKTDGGNIQRLLKLKSNNLPKKDENVAKTLDTILKTKLPNLKLHTLLKKNGEAKSVTPLGLGKNKLNIPKLKTSLAPKSSIGAFVNEDSNPSPSIIQEQVTDRIENSNTPNFGLKLLLSAHNKHKPPLSLPNLLNLKDVELIPPKKPKLNLPGLSLLPPLRVNLPGTNFIKERKTKSERLTKNCNVTAKTTNGINIEQKDRTVHTEILDSLPHASENSPIINTNNIELETTTARIINVNFVQINDKNIKTQILDALPSASEHESSFASPNGTNVDNIRDNTIHVEILDALPSASEHNEFVPEDESNIDLNKPTTEVETEDLETQHFEETTVTVPTDKLSKDNVGNIDVNENSLEVTIDDKGNSQIEEFEIFEESDQPVNEIDVSESALNEEGEVVDLEIEDDDANESHSDLTSNIENTESFDNEEEHQESNNFGLDAEQEADETITGNESEDTITGNEFFRYKSLDPVPETSNQNIQIASVEETENQNVLREDSLILGEPTEQQEFEYLPTTKNDLVFKINNLRHPENTVFTISSKSESFETNLDGTEKSSLNSDEFTNVEPLTSDTGNFPVIEKSSEKLTCESNQLGMKDLQDMSNSLLRKSEAEKENISISSESENIGILVENSSDINRDKIKQADLDMGSSATILQETLTENKGLKKIDESLDVNAKADILNANVIADNTCPSTFQISKFEPSEEITKPAANLHRAIENEMESGASETVFNTFPQIKLSKQNPVSSLLQQSIIVQPPSLLPLLPPLDLNNLPTLDDITSGITNLLAGNPRAVENGELSQTDFDVADDCSETNPVMSSDASDTSKKTAFPELRRLEDINLDIFQLNPLQGSPLNLNSFRTRLPLPKSLQLKPLKLQSALGGSNGGLLGATLTFGPKKISSSHNMKPVIRLGSMLNRQGSDILRDPLASIPSLEDLRSSMRANVQSLLTSPVVKHINSPIEDTLRSTQTLGDSLRSHTENTMRNIQQSLSSTLNEARVSGRNSAGEKFAKPENLLEMVSSAHEDMNDKLHAIHIDLQDRLSSIHDRIIDQTKLPIPTLQSPLLSSLGRLQDNPTMNNIRGRNDFKTSKQSLRTPSPKLIVRKRKPTPKGNKPIPKSKEQNQVKPFKISKAASSLTPKSIEVPKLMATSSKPPFMRPLQRDQAVKLQETRPLFETEQKQTPIRKPFKPFNIQTKITISTTPSPVSFRSQPAKPLFREQSTQLGTNQRLGEFRSFTDLGGYASEPQPSRVSAPVKSMSKTFDSEESLQRLQATPSQSTLPEFTLGNPLKSRPLKPQIRLPSLKSSPSLSLPKSTESPIVSKMREAIRIRLSRPIHPHPTEKLQKGILGKPRIDDDMSKSASETKGVMLKAEPMKENVSYKCKMICVRE